MTTGIFIPNEHYFTRRNLPHLTPPGSTLFITYRLAGSLPEEVRRRLWAQYHADLEKAGPDPVALDVAHRLFFGRWDKALHQGAGHCWLAETAVATAVSQRIHQLRREGFYQLLAYCIMPNHVHLVLIYPSRAQRPLSYVLQLLKGHTAFHANILLGRNGTFWQDESYDHLVRNDAELSRIVRYVVLNPVKAGLVTDWRAWPHTYLTKAFRDDPSLQ